MSNFKKHQVVMLPTNEKANSLKGYRDESLLFEYRKHYAMCEASIEATLKHFHLYILSNDEIKKGDWVVSGTGTIVQCLYPENVVHRDVKKIIATTNTFLTVNNFDDVNRIEDFEYKLPQPPQSFIEEHIREHNKGNIITDVMVEYEYFHGIKTSIAEVNAISGDGSMEWEGVGDFRDCKLKVNPKNNTISIKQVKNSWSREEVENLLNKMYVEFAAFPTMNIDVKNQWINNNL